MGLHPLLIWALLIGITIISGVLRRYFKIGREGRYVDIRIFIEGSLAALSAYYFALYLTTL